MTSKSQPGGIVWTYEYDANGNLTAEVDPELHRTEYDYDALNRLTTIRNFLNSTAIEVELVYDLAGRLTELIDARGKSWTYGYDAADNLLWERDPLAQQRDYTYDLANRRTQAEDARGIVVSYTYDDSGNLDLLSYPGGTVDYSYDGLNRKTQMVDATGTTSWTYDSMSNITAVASPQGTIDYAYDDTNRRTSMTLPGSRTLAYTYDDNGNLATVTDPSSRVMSYGYNLADQQVSVSRPNGIDTTKTYDSAGRLDAIRHYEAATNSDVLVYDYTLDLVGNRTAISGSVTESYSYDDLNRIVGATYTNGDSASFTYDAAGNRLSQTQTLGGVQTVTNYTYNDAGEMTSDGVRNYSYDANGNLITAGTDTFAWDYADRMTSATVSGTTTAYAYDGDHVRTSATTSGTTTNYLWDRTPALPVMVTDGTTAYVHADGIQQEIDALGTPRYHLTDALGSVRGVYDLSGTQSAATEYEVFGDVRASSGTPSLFAYAGEQHDPTTGFTHLRARDYDPATGRFTARDTVQPNADGTQGYNRYAYVANNPCSATDPSGNAPFCPWEAIIWGVVSGIVIFVAGLVAFNIARLQWNVPAAQLAATVMIGGLVDFMFWFALMASCLAAIIHWYLSGFEGQQAGSSNPGSPSTPSGLTGAAGTYPSSPSAPTT